MRFFSIFMESGIKYDICLFLNLYYNIILMQLLLINESGLFSFFLTNWNF